MSDSKPSERRIGRPNVWIQRESRSVPWLWEGVVAEDAVTLLSAPEKIGKTTLLSLLLDRRRAGGQLLGGSVLPGKTILCSEEHDRLWSLRQPPLDFGPGLTFHTPEGDHRPAAVGCASSMICAIYRCRSYNSTSW